MQLSSSILTLFVSLSISWQVADGFGIADRNLSSMMATNNVVSMDPSATTWQQLSSQRMSQQQRSSTSLFSAFKQNRGESDMDFIRRITSHSAEIASQSQANTATDAAVDTGVKNKTSGTKYVPIEEWEASRKESGSMTWEEKVQFDGQRNGDRFRQNSILQKHLGSF